MPLDPFRIQLLTLTLDSQVVLTLVGLAVAGLAFRLAARQAGFPELGAGVWWDVVTAGVVGARAVWVATHLEYYARGPLQALVITDGGLHPAGLALGAAYATWRLAGRQPERGAWRPIVELLAVGVLVAALFERAGCALTTCGGGPPADVAWALRRGDELRQPIALYQVSIVAVALLLATQVPRLAGRALPLALAALALVQGVALVWASSGPEGLLALALLAGLVLAPTLGLGRTLHAVPRPLPAAMAGEPAQPEPPAHPELVEGQVARPERRARAGTR